jgi:hypothetical protein
MSRNTSSERLSTALILTILLAGVLLTSCSRANQPSPSDGGSATAPSTPAPPKTGFEADLDWVRKGQYTYVWVFSRKDGKQLDRDDGAYLRTNAPQVVDWVTTDEGRKVIAGTNFDLAEGNLQLIKKRFNAEDYSGQ